MAYHARPCQFVTLSPFLLCIIHGYPPRPVCRRFSSSPLSATFSIFLSLFYRFYRFCFSHRSSFSSFPLPIFSPLFYVSLSTSLSICLPFRLFSLVHLVSVGLLIARWFSLFLSLSLCEDADAARQRTGKAHRHHTISFIVPGPPRIQAAMARPGVATERRKRLQTGAGGNDRITIAIATMLLSSMLRRHARLQSPSEILINYN